MDDVEWTDILKVLQQIGNCFSFAIGQHGLIEAIAGPPCRKRAGSATIATSIIAKGEGRLGVGGGP